MFNEIAHSIRIAPSIQFEAQSEFEALNLKIMLDYNCCQFGITSYGISHDREELFATYTIQSFLVGQLANIKN